jgi:hypothetical protein
MAAKCCVYFDRQPIFPGALLQLILEQHPTKERYQEKVFSGFFRESLESGGALIAIDSNGGKKHSDRHSPLGGPHVLCNSHVKRQ